MEGFLGSKLFENILDDSVGTHVEQRSDLQRTGICRREAYRLVHSFESCVEN